MEILIGLSAVTAICLFIYYVVILMKGDDQS